VIYVRLIIHAEIILEKCLKADDEMEKGYILLRGRTLSSHSPSRALGFASYFQSV
jgi:hypothetical protein